MRTAQQRIFRGAEHIDKTRGDNLLVRVDDTLRRHPSEARTYVSDSVTARCDRATIPRIPGAIDDTRVRYQYVVPAICRRRRSLNGTRSRHNKRDEKADTLDETLHCAPQET